MPPIAPSDELLAACRAGDREAFARLFDLCRDRVYAIALGICGDPAGAADVSQDVFMKLLGRFPQFAGRATFATWLYRIVVNTAIDQRRAGRRTVAMPAQIETGERVDEAYAREERRRRVERAVHQLPAKLRAPLILRHLEGLNYAEIAAVLRISPGTVASRLSRAHARLARDLAHEVS